MTDSKPVDRAPLPPEISELELVWELFQWLESDRSVAALALAREVSQDTIYRAVSRVEQWLGQKVIRRSRGHHAEPAENGHSIIAPIGEVVEKYRELIPHRCFRTRVYVDSGMTMFIGPLINEFKVFQEEYDDVDVVLHYDQPVNLRGRAREGLCDISIVSVHHDMVYPSSVKATDLQLALIGPHNHSFIKECRTEAFIPWEKLAHHTLALISNRSPSPPYPDEVIANRSIHKVHYDSYAILHAMVAAGGAVTISLPQLLTEDQYDRLDVISYPSAKSVRMAIIRPEKTRMLRTERERKIIANLADILSARLEQMARYVYESPRHFDAYFVIGGENGTLDWLKGDLRCRMPSSGRIGGAMDVRIGEDLSQYEIRGFVERSERNQFCVMFEGKKDGRIEDVFSTSFILSSINDLNEPFAGTWQGRQARTVRKGTNILIPAAGHVLLIPKSWKGSKDISSKDVLTRIARDYNESAGSPISLPYPGAP